MTSPGLKLDQNFIYFGCQEKDDVIHFVEKEEQLPESRISVESMRVIKQTIHQAVKEQFGRKEGMAEENG